jgi:hypothetical protein
MATKLLSEMTDTELRDALVGFGRDVRATRNATDGMTLLLNRVSLILANQYDTELTRREKENGE